MLPTTDDIITETQKNTAEKTVGKTLHLYTKKYAQAFLKDPYVNAFGILEVSGRPPLGGRVVGRLSLATTNASKVDRASAAPANRRFNVRNMSTRW